MSYVIAQKTMYAKLTRSMIGVSLLYLFHISAIIGIALGHLDWFAVKTPLNLSLLFLLCCWIYPIEDRRTVIVSVFFFLAGMFVEIMGVQYGLFFGDYAYGDNLGFKILGVPFLIGINWCVLVLITGCISNHIFNNKYLRVISGASLMLILDFFMESSAPVLDFWEFEHSIAPLSNYLAWFVIALILHGVFQGFNSRGHFGFSLHAFLNQLIFFAFLYYFL